MKAFRFAVLAFVLTMFTLPGCAAQSAAGSNPQQQSSPSNASTPIATMARPRVTEYTLPPDLYKKARDRSRIHFQLALIGFFYGLVVLWLILHWKLAPKYRDWAERLSHRRFLQAVVFAHLLLLTLAVLTLPVDIYYETVERKFGISVQGWGSWTWD